MSDSDVRERPGRSRGAGRLAFDLVTSKLSRPPVRPGSVGRSRLIDLLARADLGPVVSVVAPAGYGKTTLLSQWAERSASAFAWVSAAHDDLQNAVPLKLSHRVSATGEAIVIIDGELDIATIGLAVSYLNNVIDQHRGPVIADLAPLRFCDAQGLNALLRVAGHAQRAGHPFQLASPSPRMLKILRITGLDRQFPISRHPPPDHPEHTRPSAHARLDGWRPGGRARAITRHTRAAPLCRAGSRDGG